MKSHITVKDFSSIQTEDNGTIRLIFDMMPLVISEAMLTDRSFTDRSHWHWKAFLDTREICNGITRIWLCQTRLVIENIWFPIQHTSFTYIFIWVRKLDSNSLTKTKNWSGRNEVTETSGGLHPLWSQNKSLHKPRTTDYRHTRQGRLIQMELAFTLAKIATKSNTFEIIPLHTTRMENNWKTEEVLARAAVTLETERIKGSDPWCLWWWNIWFRILFFNVVRCLSLRLHFL